MVVKLKNVFFRIFVQLRDGELQTIATSMAFTTALSIVPLLAISFSIFHALGGFESFYNFIQPKIMNYFAESASEAILHQVAELGEKLKSTSLGITGFVVFLFTSTKLFYDMDTSIQKIWHINRNRSFLKRIPVYTLIVLLLPVLVSIGFGVYSSILFDVVPEVPLAWMSFALSMLSLYIIYVYVPNQEVKKRYALISALTTSTLGLLSQFFYLYAMKNIMNYSKFYGSLASIPIFMVWILILWFIFLLGASLCSNLQKSYELATQANS